MSVTSYMGYMLKDYSGSIRLDKNEHIELHCFILHVAFKYSY